MTNAPFTCPSYRARRTGCPVYPFDIDIGDCSAMFLTPPAVGLESGFNHLPKRITKDQLTPWRMQSVRLHPNTWVGTSATRRQCEGLPQQRLRYSWEHLKMYSRQVAYSEPGTITTDYADILLVICETLRVDNNGNIVRGIRRLEKHRTTVSKNTPELMRKAIGDRPWQFRSGNCSLLFGTGLQQLAPHSDIML